MANIKLKLGNLELESEGSEEFLKAEVPNFWKLAVETQSKIPTASTTLTPANGRTHTGGSGGATAKSDVQGTTETLAAKLGVKKSPDLAVAAASRIVFVERKDTFTRDELLTEMQTATAYYDANHRKNLTQTLQNLVKAGTFNGIAQDRYALSANAKTEIEAKICG